MTLKLKTTKEHSLNVKGSQLACSADLLDLAVDVRSKSPTHRTDLEETIEFLELERDSLSFALAEAHGSLKAISSDFQHLPFTCLILDQGLVIRECSDRTARLLGFDDSNDLSGRNLASIFHHRSRRRLQNIIQTIKNIDSMAIGITNDEPRNFEAWIDRPRNTPLNAIISIQPITSSTQSQQKRFAALIVEYSMTLGHQAHYDHHQKWDSDALSIQIKSLDEICNVNTSLPSLEDIAIENHLVMDHCIEERLRELDLEVIAKKKSCQDTCVLTEQSGELVGTARKIILIHKFPLSDPTGELSGVGTVLFPMSEVPETSSFPVTQSSRPSERDALTSCLTRTAILGTLETELARARKSAISLTVLSIDLDGFKGINDGLGHQIGDSLLRAASARMMGAFSDVGFVGRLSGDEFLIVVPNTPSSLILPRVDRLLDQMRTPCSIDGTDLVVTCSIGIASFPADAENGFDLVRASDVALYRSKESGRDMATIFESSMLKVRDRNATIMSKLHQALASEEFYLVYQPQYELAGRRRLVGVECLLRWYDSDLGEVSPAEFIPLAFQCGLGLSIDLWVVKTCLAQKTLWGAGDDTRRVAINTSATSFLTVGFAKQILCLMNLHGLKPSQIRIEITESTLMQKSFVSSQNLSTLREAGVGISIDDFGTGYSCLAAIHELKPAEIKIDRSFLDRIHEQEPSATKPLELIISLAKSLGLDIVAEGIETEQQLDWLVKNGCPIGQGYLMSKPVDCRQRRLLDNF
jgi:diguanylate cyclase